MKLELIDWIIIILFFAISLFIGIYTSRKASSSYKEFFLGGSNMPWWLLGVSMVATTFSADTPNLVTDLVRQGGVAANWSWWAFLLTGMLTVFIYAKLWRRSEVLTDLEFYEIRYSGPSARFLRGFRAIYLGVFLNVLIMATVTLAAIKIGAVLLGLEPWQTILVASVVTVIYSSLGGLRGVILTDFVQFIMAMVGTIAAAIYILDLPEIGGLEALVNHPDVIPKLDVIPSSENGELIKLLIIPIAVQWWAAWYPGAEPGGGGYIAQRMLSAKSEDHAMGATLFFNIAHYALRPWPWILIALASLIVFPTTDSILEKFPNIDAGFVGEDLAYSAMLTYLPAGLIGLVVASLIAAYMSTISTHLNWGSSYLVNDFYLRFINPDAEDKELVWMGRACTVGLMVLAAGITFLLQNAKEAFDFLLQIGAGTGAIFILRWFWWRINAWTEIAGMVISFIVALILQIDAVQAVIPSDYIFVIGVLVTTIGWVVVTLLTPPEDDEILTSFYDKIRPYSFGWKPIIEKGRSTYHWYDENSVGKFILDLSCMIIGCFMVYGFLIGTGYFLYGNYLMAGIGFLVGAAGGLFLLRSWKRIDFK